jgi:hypothetical protein
MSALKLDIEKRRFVYINIPLTLSEKQQIVKAAMAKGQLPAVFSRAALLEASALEEPAA